MEKYRYIPPISFKGSEVRECFPGIPFEKAMSLMIERQRAMASDGTIQFGKPVDVTTVVEDKKPSGPTRRIPC